jgi:hypothetical protein
MKKQEAVVEGVIEQVIIHALKARDTARASPKQRSTIKHQAFFGKAASTSALTLGY